MSKEQLINKNGFLFSEDELAQASQTVGANEKLNDLESLCNGKSFRATYLDLRRMADSNLVYMYGNSDSNWDVDRLAKLIEDHPFLFTRVHLIKEEANEESDIDCLPYQLTLESIETLISFYFDNRGAGFTSLIDLCFSRYKPYYIEAEIHGLNESDGQSCSLRLFCEDK